MSSITRICSNCQSVKPVSSFGRLTNGEAGKICGPCADTLKIQRYETIAQRNRERVKGRPAAPMYPWWTIPDPEPERVTLRQRLERTEQS